MADLKISELGTLEADDLATGDLLAVVDNSASETKKLSVGDLIAQGVTLISDDTIPGAKILFAEGSIPTAALVDEAVSTAKIAADAVTSAELADESTVDLVTALPTSGAFTGQLALDTDDNKLYLWDGSAWQSLKGAGSVNAVTGATSNLLDINVSTSDDTVEISASVVDTSAANQFLAGPTSAGGTATYRTIDGSDIPVATASAKGGVVVNAEGLRMDSNTIEIDNDVTASTTHHVVTYDSKGLITGGRELAASDLPLATASSRGAVIPGTGLSINASGSLDHTNTATTGTFTKVTIDGQGHVSTGATLEAADIPDISASKITSGTISSDLIGTDAVTGANLADQSTVKFGGASATDNVVTFPEGEFKGQFFFDESTDGDLYIFTGQSFQPITVISGNLVNAGTYDASTDQMVSVTTAGSAAGFTATQALPAPSSSNLNYYVIVETAGTGSGNAPAVQLDPPDILVSLGVTGTKFQLIAVSDTISVQSAAGSAFTPQGNISASNVSDALVELDTEKLAKAGGTMTGDLNLGLGVDIVFEGASANAHETTITVTDPTADRTIAFPDAGGTVVTTDSAGAVTSAMIANSTIVNGDISTTADIAVSKLANGTARQLLQTDASGTNVEFASDIDVPGTLDVTGAATLDSTLQVDGNITANGNLIFEGSTANEFETTLTVIDPTADQTITLPDATTTVAGLAVAQSFTKAQRGTPVALTDAATIAVDLSLGNNFSVTLGGNRILGDPTNVTAGQSGVIVVTQDGTGSRTLSYEGTKYKFAGGTAPTLTTTASAVDVLAYYAESASRITVTSLLNVS